MLAKQRRKINGMYSFNASQILTTSSFVTVLSPSLTLAILQHHAPHHRRAPFPSCLASSAACMCQGRNVGRDQRRRPALVDSLGGHHGTNRRALSGGRAGHIRVIGCGRDGQTSLAQAGTNEYELSGAASRYSQIAGRKLRPLDWHDKVQ